MEIQRAGVSAHFFADHHHLRHDGGLTVPEVFPNAFSHCETTARPALADVMSTVSKTILVHGRPLLHASMTATLVFDVPTAFV